MDQIRSYKVVTGEEVIARVGATNDEAITLSRARIVVMQQMQGGQIGVGFMPFMVSNLSDNGELYLRKDSIVAEQVPSKEIEAAYLKNTTGIELASSLT